MKCVCCGKPFPAPDARVGRGPIHFECWVEHHSDPTEAHGCEGDS